MMEVVGLAGYQLGNDAQEVGLIVMDCLGNLGHFHILPYQLPADQPAQPRH